MISDLSFWSLRTSWDRPFSSLKTVHFRSFEPASLWLKDPPLLQILHVCRSVIFAATFLTVHICISSTFSDRPLLQNGHFCWSSTLADRPLLQTGRFCTSSTLILFMVQLQKWPSTLISWSSFGPEELFSLIPIQCLRWAKSVHFQDLTLLSDSAHLEFVHFSQVGFYFGRSTFTYERPLSTWSVLWRTAILQSCIFRSVSRKYNLKLSVYIFLWLLNHVITKSRDISR